VAYNRVQAHHKEWRKYDERENAVIRKKRKWVVEGLHAGRSDTTRRCERKDRFSKKGLLKSPEWTSDSRGMITITGEGPRA